MRDMSFNGDKEIWARIELEPFEKRIPLVLLDGVDTVLGVVVALDGVLAGVIEKDVVGVEAALDTLEEPAAVDWDGGGLEALMTEDPDAGFELTRAFEVLDELGAGPLLEVMAPVELDLGATPSIEDELLAWGVNGGAGP